MFWTFIISKTNVPNHLFDYLTFCCRFADLLQACGQSVAFLGKRSDIAVELSKQQWHTSDKQVEYETGTILILIV